MKMTIVICMTLALLAGAGCQFTKNSSQGGIVLLNQEFNINVPTSVTIKQGEHAAVVIALHRGAYFKQDVELYVNAVGISVTPSYVLVKASDKPDVPFMITVARDTAIGEYRVTVKGMPVTGNSTSTVFTVKVLAQ